MEQKKTTPEPVARAEPSVVSELAAELRISVARLSRRLRRQARSGLSVTQLSALVTLDKHTEMTPRELAGHEHVKPPSMTRTVASLEAAGLVARRAHPTDGRQVVLALTDSGRSLLVEHRRLKEAWLAQRLAELTAEERAALERAAPILERLSRM
ncbi:MarR family transcriptional regulator [Actinocorallia sp. API 0066]|uniref:MarR family winged helix-turn-helix transcriptional regulator n=1 Tax=Actinocorallia sp. API 0066 TaxID=2896846 RepID=UPI001E3EEE03|nr:MarR family transcriptional regulator [Actinocorallia sp. API 0066]MCD0447682.1 MarR family transcriptional regulator [Actinocorallia sp. API 0066]